MQYSAKMVRFKTVMTQFRTWMSWMWFRAKNSVIHELITLLRANQIAEITSHFKMDMDHFLVLLPLEESKSEKEKNLFCHNHNSEAVVQCIDSIRPCTYRKEFPQRAMADGWYWYHYIGVKHLGWMNNLCCNASFLFRSKTFITSIKSWYLFQYP